MRSKIRYDGESWKFWQNFRELNWPLLQLCAIWWNVSANMTRSCLPVIMRSSRTRRPEAIALLVISISNTEGSRRQLNPQVDEDRLQCTQGTHTWWILVLQQTTSFFFDSIPLYTTRLHCNLWPRSPRRSACHASRRPETAVLSRATWTLPRPREKKGEPPHEPEAYVGPYMARLIWLRPSSHCWINRRIGQEPNRARIIQW